ncbi:uncharacterized protein LOC130562943 isoform X2 [Triplophysa rosa]|uniref:uncharacterized protein LOC130562943 isoform X2 n=1 Tax=Triplophysa rosa TaxID=992332 RepID=UPI0025460806|nr:uncharacterized protein LOC130562943 isoform X2 [Triplophysa rosa]
MAGLFLLTFVFVKLLLQTQGQNIHHAKIYSVNREVAEGGSLQVTCSTFGYTTKSVYLYLCHNGKAIEIKKSNQADVAFIINSIEKDNSGNYSCVFSEERLLTTQVTGYGENHVFIQVTESLIPAEIRLLKADVSEGSDAEFNCSTSNPLNTTQPRKMILAFLLKNGRTIQVNTWDTTETMTTFTLRKVRLEDAGTYSCVVMLNILPHPDKRLCGKNEVNLQIKQHSASVSNSNSGEVRLAIMCFIILLVISLLLGIWLITQKRGFIGCLNKRCLNNEEQLRETEVVYEAGEAEATGETQSICELSEWNEFSDSEEDQHVYQACAIPGIQPTTFRFSRNALTTELQETKSRHGGNMCRVCHSVSEQWM